MTGGRFAGITKVKRCTESWRGAADQACLHLSAGNTANVVALARQPACDARDGFVHLRKRTRIGKPDESAAMYRIEVDAGRGGDVNLLQHLTSECKTVGAKFRDIRVKVEGAVGRQKIRKTRARQALDQDTAILPIAVLDRLHLLAALESRFGGDLRQRRDRDREILLQP